MANQLLGAALAYARRGWPIFPCNAIKQPMTINGVLDATTDQAQIERWWQTWPRANIALDVAGAGFMVLDLDPGHDRAALEKTLSGLPPTKLHQRSPRGGEHLFYELSPGEVVAPSASKIAPFVDVRSFHSYVLLAPSTTADGGYTWVGEGKAAYRTDEMVRLANIAKQKSADRDNWLIEADLPENVAAASKWLRESAKIAVEGQGGDNMAYATAAHMKSFGISEALAFDLIWEHWNPRCSPPWSADEVEHLETKIRNGYSYNTSPPGNVTPAYHVAKTQRLFSPIEAEIPTGREINAGRFRFVDRDGMDHIQPPEWLVHDLITQDSYSLLYGTRGAFKTFVALDIALSIATGFSLSEERTWADVPGMGNVLYCAGEGRGSIKNRIAAWERTHNGSEKVHGLVLSDPVPNVAEDWEPFLEGALAMAKDGYKLVVLDTIGRAMQGVNENAQEHASKFTQMVETIKKEFGASVLAIHHAGHEGAAHARGSSVFEADADTVLRIDRNAKDYAVSLSMTKQKDAAQWERPMFCKLSVVKLTPKIESLAAVKTDERNVPKGPSKPSPADEEEVLNIIQAGVVRALASNKARAFTQMELAAIVGCDESVGLSSELLRKRYLVVLREDRKRAVAKAYDPLTRRWRYAG